VAAGGPANGHALLPEKRKVGGSTPPLTTPSTLAKMLLYAAETRLIGDLFRVPAHARATGPHDHWCPFAAARRLHAYRR
jgi:hypothetical protein